MTNIINMFGAPGSGKSTTAASVFSELKRRNWNVELVTEFAKELVWDESLEVLKDQLYLTACQNRRLERLMGKVDYIITDSPLLMGAYYGLRYGNHADIVVPFVHQLVSKYGGVNIFIHRTKPFNPVGRIGDAQGSDLKAAQLLKYLNENKVPLNELKDDKDITKNVIEIIEVIERHEYAVC